MKIRYSARPEPVGLAPNRPDADSVAHLNDHKPRGLSLLGAALTRLSLRISPLVKADLLAAQATELERYFNERLLSELHDRVEAIIARRLPERVEGGSANAVAPGGITADDVIASIEMILGRTPDQALVDYHLKLGFPDRFALGKYMLSTDEFRAQFFGGSWRHLFLGDRVLAFTHRGHIIYLVPSDLDLTPGILLYGRHEPHVEEVITASIRPGDTAVDIGANVGYHTLAMAATVGSSGQVHAFEANPDVMRLLKATMVVNKFSTFRGTGRVTLHEHAALDRPGSITLASAPGHYGSGHVINDTPSSDYGPAYSTRVEVPAVTLDAVLANHVGMVDFIHMDIEGSEPLALRGGQELIERSPQMKIVTEWSVGMMSTRSNVGDFVAWLVERSFRLWLIEPGASGVRLTKLEPSAALTLPHCDLFLSRQDPPG